MVYFLTPAAMSLIFVLHCSLENPVVPCPNFELISLTARSSIFRVLSRLLWFSWTPCVVHASSKCPTISGVHVVVEGDAFEDDFAAAAPEELLGGGVAGELSDASDDAASSASASPVVIVPPVSPGLPASSPSTSSFVSTCVV